MLLSCSGRMDVENVLPGLDNNAHQKLTAKSQELSAQRKTRVRTPSFACQRFGY